MTRTGSDDATLDRLTDKSHVADDVEKLMTCAFVLPLQRSVLDIAQLVGIHARNLKMVGELVKLSLRLPGAHQITMALSRSPPLIRLACSNGMMSRTKTKVRAEAISSA